MLVLELAESSVDHLRRLNVPCTHETLNEKCGDALIGHAKKNIIDRKITPVPDGNVLRLLCSNHWFRVCLRAVDSVALCICSANLSGP
eukprot:Skav203898  [mRNA]  locus=scaffold1649:187328:187591:+ [translate_table: standard]